MIDFYKVTDRQIYEYTAIEFLNKLCFIKDTQQHELDIARRNGVS